MNKSYKTNFLGGLFFISIIFSFIFLEDSLGGARHDFLFHEKFIILFAEDFKNTFNNYGQGELFARNSPIFYIFLSLLYKIGLSLDSIRFLNILSIPLLLYIFTDCLSFQFKNINKNLLILTSFIIFLSPTIRSLVVWPYPNLYGLILFLFSIKFFLSFNKEKKGRLGEALKNILFLALASYITPNFSVFVIFFLYKFFFKLKNLSHFIFIVIFNLLLATPAIIYYFINDFYLFNVTVSGADLNLKLNIFNKIIIISTLVFFYFIPFIDNKIIKNTQNVLKNFYKEYVLILFFFICVYFFNFPYGNFGGGIFFHFSQNFFENNFLLFSVFALSLILFKSAKLINLSNIILFSCLVFYNMQVSIYHKYFDPLLLFVFLFLLNRNEIKSQKIYLELIKKYYFLYIFFLGISFYKVYFL